MNLKCRLHDFQVAPGKNVNLAKWPTRVKPLYASKSSYRKLLEEFREEISDLQRVLYAHNRYALLLIFQGMDTAGKDGAIRHVMSGVNPQGCQVFSFKQPSSEELDHDFLWRTNKRLPERGRIGIFNRSYYEEVLVVRVHPEFLDSAKLPPECLDGVWDKRFQDINNIEQYLVHNGIIPIKFFLNVSRDEQLKRFLKRCDDPTKNWKFSASDARERALWNKYLHAYEDMLKHTSTKHAPWYVVPADNKWYTRVVVSEIIVDRLQKLELHYPKISDAQRANLKAVREQLLADK
jgi:PPK2 family polyphosphate:nucleotide phosphotransferase